MDRYIKKSDVVKAILKERDKIPITMVERYGFGVPVPYQAGEAMRGGIRKALRCIEQAEMVDVVEVVRCKDCKHFNRFNEQCEQSSFYGRTMGEDGYCSLGERKEK